MNAQIKKNSETGALTEDLDVLTTRDLEKIKHELMGRVIS